MTLLLEDAGYTVYAASHGKEGLDVLNDPLKIEPGMVALDFYMPVMDANGFLSELEKAQSANRFRNVVVVLVTAADASARAGIDLRVAEVLRKPINLDAFLFLAEKYCGKP